MKKEILASALTYSSIKRSMIVGQSKNKQLVRREKGNLCSLTSGR